MKQFIQSLATFAVLAAGLFAQGPKGPNPSAPAAGQPMINVAASATVSGKIAAVQIAYGAQYPSITLEGKTIKIAPVWFLLDNDFELAAGEDVRALVAPSSKPGDPSLYALSMTKSASGVTLIMRSDSGTPLWTSPGNGNSQAARRQNPGTGCVDASSIVEAKGIIDSVAQGAGIQQPQLTLVTNGRAITIKIGPEKNLLAADIELKTGMPLTVRYATASFTGELIALSLGDENGRTILLRNDDGTPAWN